MNEILMLMAKTEGIKSWVISFFKYNNKMTKLY
jgi:hypothetical protein